VVHNRRPKGLPSGSPERSAAHNEEEAKPDVRFVVIPDDVRKYCRPQSIIEPAVRIEAKRYFAENIRDNVRKAKQLIAQPSLFQEDNKAAEPYSYKEHFRNQLKAKLLPHRISTQVVRESTVANVGPGRESRREQSEELLQSQIAWNISTTAFYKAGARPWKVTGIREGVAYVGLVFKRYNSGSDNRSAACGAQMFLDSGDGVVFKGAVGKWYDSATEEYHLTTEAAKALMSLTVESYKAKHNNEPPKELFIHGQNSLQPSRMGRLCRSSRFQDKSCRSSDQGRQGIEAVPKDRQSHTPGHGLHQ
jgi:hypothetical protein